MRSALTRVVLLSRVAPLPLVIDGRSIIINRYSSPLIHGYAQDSNVNGPVIP
jgi:hypothetical protein